MRNEELNEIKSMVLTYGDPLRGRVLALIATVETLQSERVINSVQKIDVGMEYVHVKPNDSYSTIAIKRSVVDDIHRMMSGRSYKEY